MSFVQHCEEDESKSRVVTQFQFTGWRYDDVPSYTFSFLKFVQRVRTYHDGLETSHPMVVHCRYITVYYCLKGHGPDCAHARRTPCTTPCTTPRKPSLWLPAAAAG